ncbi:hypothetical protein COS31_00980 [Candidatus Roizmanbacteria bacterium CG02_land_8_20_14_3_00_36_15]|uniref:Uncharacterized protein n=2 Tax=Candidatus Roizmaniibacteriota TaxID=1752723 RepID=A0A2M8KLC5_9BACT|nr:MAG: hypothetical protein COS51_04010 [Candidatus Roizmanbacteria bacterium CG03_land_8_20_14_0_80_36_21]PIV38132.1 MAG: hypothetical protein COS31_00980 [Candidatus Roizmanbacteria bacterium CG02_land_8_20_14_3_00_36_15]PIY70303.1 MAG: hypothetical protein COY89_01785 [Candidatus Roizmanbacteria bacterium CG_4_10_14_0_8_um_filter_36_36]PJA53282.1 MAG: hypothetical protein CO166_02455 [Candidatus Roizmanbacteria bacterium CG_4_9_14_3_um_filter_36_11]PJC82129.1 MAG: hypothetical protein CO007
MYKRIQKNQTMYQCPFCKRDIVSSKKTEVYYRSYWMNGCIDCFILSISKATSIDFQTKNY